MAISCSARAATCKRTRPRSRPTAISPTTPALQRSKIKLGNPVNTHWLVYSTNPANDNDGGLTPDFIQYASTYNVGTLTGTAPATSGNAFLYSVAPTITVTNVTKVYDGTTGMPTAASAYTSSGAINSDSVTLNTSDPTGAYASRNVGTGIGVTALDEGERDRDQFRHPGLRPCRPRRRERRRYRHDHRRRR